MTKQGIDVSQWQGDIEWSRVKTDFVLIRAGYGRASTQTDTKFSANYTGCKSAGIPCGAYWFSYAESVEDARLEAKACLDVIRGKQFEYPIYYDVEDARILALGKAKVSGIIRAFLDALEAEGYFAGLYMSAEPFLAYTEEDIRSRYALWIADYTNKRPNISGLGVWQKSSSGSVTGITGNVDLDEAYIDYPEIIKEAEKNGFGSTHEHTLTVIIDGKTVVKDYKF